MENDERTIAANLVEAWNLLKNSDCKEAANFAEALAEFCWNCKSNDLQNIMESLENDDTETLANALELN